MKFRQGNKILYGQDRRFRHGLPAGVDFTVTRFGMRYDLTAHGYGGRGDKKSYGNGSLIACSLTARQRRRFEKHVTGDK